MIFIYTFSSSPVSVCCKEFVQGNVASEQTD